MWGMLGFGEIGHDAAPAGVEGRLRGDQVSERPEARPFQSARRFHHAHRRLVTARFDTEDYHKTLR